MRHGGTPKRRAAVAASAAFVCGLATAVVGLSAGTALADPTSLSYTCSGTVRHFTLTVTAVGAVAGTPKVGDAVTLGGFRLAMSATEVQFSKVRATGAFEDLTVSATDANGADAGSAALTDVPVDIQASDNGTLTVTVVSPQPLSGFTATAEGTMTFSLPTEIVAHLDLSALDGFPLDTVTLTCDTTDSAFATVDVAPADNNGGNGSPPPTQTTPPPTQTTPPPTPSPTPSSTANAISARSLASTGVPNAIPLTAGGTAMVLLGAGLLVAARRRRALVVDGSTDGEWTTED
ncbi:MAG TPA: hypothetical protein VFX70_17940 [Mycobacteriales bacterium]|nr:hypothetical protein [Mycobacteriales bacterium]